MSHHRKNQSQKSSSSSSSPPTPQRFIEHIYELRRRLIWVALCFVLTTGVAVFFMKQIMAVLIHPLGHEKLYYLTPVGGLSFMITLCMYLGLIATTPVIIYNLYQFLAPVIHRRTARSALAYTCFSSLLAATGVVFTYLVSLPTTLHYLTNFNSGQINAMLTANSYLTFVMGYLLAGALLFQVPLIMLIIDSIKPTPPSTLLHYERHALVGSFIVGMIATPSPDILTQVVVAVPIFLTYQLGILLVAIKSRKKRARPTQEAYVAAEEPAAITAAEAPVMTALAAAIEPQPDVLAPKSARRAMDVISPKRPTQHLQVIKRPDVPLPPRRSIGIDGFRLPPRLPETGA